MAEVPEHNEGCDRWYQFPQFGTGFKAMNSKGRRPLQAVNHVRIVEIKKLQLRTGYFGVKRKRFGSPRQVNMN